MFGMLGMAQGLVAAAVLMGALVSCGCRGMGTDGEEAGTPSRAPVADGFIPWSQLSNPILAEADRAIDDPTVVFHDGYFYVFASARLTDEDRPGTAWHYYRTRDFKTFQTLTAPQLSHPYALDLVRANGQFHAFYHLAQPHGGAAREPGAYGLFRTSSADLLQWTPVQPVLRYEDPDARHLDPAAAVHAGFFYMGFERWHQFHVSRTRFPGPDSVWLTPRKASADGEWAADYQFIQIDGAWRMVATGQRAGAAGRSVGDAPPIGPFIYTMDGTGDRVDDWAAWADRKPLAVPVEAWNRAIPARGSYLCDWREYDGHFYLFYAGAADTQAFDGTGDTKIGAARSRDLVTWELPGR